MAVFTNGRVVTQDVGLTMEYVLPEHLGRVRRELEGGLRRWSPGRALGPLGPAVLDRSQRRLRRGDRGGALPADGTAGASTPLPASTGDLVELGIIDPIKVARSALEHAASIAALLLATDVLVAEELQGVTGEILAPGFGDLAEGLPRPSSDAATPSL
jgi:hypothetical protein